MMQFGMSKVWTMIVAVGLAAALAGTADARGHRHGGGGCCGGCYGGCWGGGYYGGCYGGGWYGGYGCCGGYYGGGYYGGGWYGSGSPRGSGTGSRYYDPYYGGYVQGSMGTDRTSGYYGTGQGQGSPATIQVRAPSADAQIWFDDYLTRQTGASRVFQTPPLSSDSDASYTLRVRWNDNGKAMDITRQIQVRGGKTIDVDLARGEDIGGPDRNRDRDKELRDRDRDRDKGSPGKDRDRDKDRDKDR
jgi:uncharacterized protein (TIGR03000 family)